MVARRTLLLFFGAHIFIGVVLWIVGVPSLSGNPWELSRNNQKQQLLKEQEQMQEQQKQRQEQQEQQQGQQQLQEQQAEQSGEEQEQQEQQEQRQQQWQEQQAEQPGEVEDKMKGSPDCPLKLVDILFPIPQGVEKDKLWRYSSKGLYWDKCDDLYQKFLKYNSTLTLPPQSVKEKVAEITNILERKKRHKLARMFRNAYLNTLDTTIQMLHDGTTYAITGDIPLMWLRDSSAQVHHYLPLAKNDPHLQVIIEGVIRRQVCWIRMDPYGSSFRLKLDFENIGKSKLTDWDYKCGRTIHVAMRDWEPDSLCYFIRLSYTYWKETGVDSIFEENWKQAADRIISTWSTEQHHNDLSDYEYPVLRNNGKGSTTCDCGLVWTGMRPSDDPCEYQFLIPTNMFIVASLRQLGEIFQQFYPKEKETLAKIGTMEKEIDDAIHKWGVVEHSGDKVYAYEVNGCGYHSFMDDANVPSLLSAPYLNYSSPHDPDNKIYKATRFHLFSPSNPYFYHGSAADGIGSPHTSTGNIWPMSIIIKAMTEEKQGNWVETINNDIKTLESTDAGKELMHESFFKDNPGIFTRDWFAWANSLFGELVVKYIDHIQ